MPASKTQDEQRLDTLGEIYDELHAIFAKLQYAGTLTTDEKEVARLRRAEEATQQVLDIVEREL